MCSTKAPPQVQCRSDVHESGAILRMLNSCVVPLHHGAFEQALHTQSALMSFMLHHMHSI
jgi:hypothetical protein